MGDIVPPRCPSCGKSARRVRAMAVVDYELTPGGFGRLIYVDRVEAKEYAFVCDEKHVWKLAATTMESSDPGASPRQADESPL